MITCKCACGCNKKLLLESSKMIGYCADCRLGNCKGCDLLGFPKIQNTKT